MTDTPLPPTIFMYEDQMNASNTAHDRVPNRFPATIAPATRVAQAVALGALAAFAASCGGESGPGKGSAAILTLNEVNNGFGQLLPHRVPELDAAGNPTGQIVSIRSLADISQHVTRGNPILPSDVFRQGAISPTGQPGNHFIYANFTQPIDPLTVLNPSPTGAGLSGAVSVTTVNPFSGATLTARGRAFVGGRTLAAPTTSGQSSLELEQWVDIDPDTGFLRALVPAAAGFPGVGTFVPNARTLISPNTILFVADTNNDLSSFEAFPSGVQVRFRVTTALRSVGGEQLRNQVLAASTVGLDTLPPEIITTPPPADAPLISPGNGDTNVDPTTAVRMEFTEPCQPYSIGNIGGAGPPGVSSAVTLEFGPSTSLTQMPFTALPISPFDLSTYILSPAFSFPGRGPESFECGTFFEVRVNLSTQQIEDLSQIPSTDPNQPNQFFANFNQIAAATNFETGEGPGIVNAPVQPDAIYAGRGGAEPGLSTIDLNGYGQTSGNPMSSQPFPLRGESRFPFDPNVALNPSARPPLIAGECTIDGGSAGVFTLTLDSSLNDLVLRAPIVSAVTDLHTGHALDGTIRNSPPLGGCQAGGGYICASDGLKLISAVQGNQPNTLAPALMNQFGALNPGYENIISWAPHPNPPKLTFPPKCVTPFIGGEEPTSIDSTLNQLVTGNPFPIPATGSPPTGLLTLEQNQFFIGPSFGQTQLAGCAPYQIRQQVGHFLYVADRARNEVVVLNSNRMSVIDRIAVPDPTSLAMGPNLQVLAVSNQLADTVTFIDIGPSSTQFHQIIQTVEVGNSPRGLAFEPTNEDVIVCNELSNSISIISAANLEVRREITSQLNRPFELCITPRMQGFSFNRAVYFGYVLNRTGNVALFESGPNGVNGWGFDDVVGIISIEFQAPKTVQIDPLNLDASVYIVHEGPIDTFTGNPGQLGDGAISRLRIESALTGAIPISGNSTVNPNFRDVQFSVPVSLSQSSGQLSGIPVDIAFDNQRNLGGLPGVATQFSAGSPVPANSKATIRGAGIRMSAPQFLFASIPNPVGGSGVVDVMALGITGTPRFDTDPYVAGVQSIPVPLVTILSDYLRQ